MAFLLIYLLIIYLCLYFTFIYIFPFLYKFFKNSFKITLFCHLPRYSIHGSRLQPPISGHPCPRSILDPWNVDKDVHWRVSCLEPSIEYSFDKVFVDELDRVLDLVEVFENSYISYSISVKGFLEELKLILVLVE